MGRGVLGRLGLVVLLVVTLAPIHAGSQRLAAAAVTLQPTTTVYLPNIVKTLGGPDGWQTPFIVQNVGTGTTDLTFDFYRFADGSLAKTRTVTGLKPGTSVFHSPNHDPQLADWNQYAVVVKSFGSQVVAVVNEHQNQLNPVRQEALSYIGLTSGSTKVYLPYVAHQASGWLCTEIIQNLGTAQASVTADFKSLDGTRTAKITRVIGAGGSKFIDPRIETTLIAGTEYAVALTADQPVGAVVNCHNDEVSVAAPRAFSYNGYAASNERFTFVPYAAKRIEGGAKTSRVFVQNAGTTAAQPVLALHPFGGKVPQFVFGPTAVAPGAGWSYDLNTATIGDGEYSVIVHGGQFAALISTVAPTSAMGLTGNTEWAGRLFLPNITRTLGGANGWTTPIIVQTQGAFVATLRWYRFADGALVHTQYIEFGDASGPSIRVDPRSVPELSDNTQYAVVVEGPGLGAAVLEQNSQGGDGSMAYEGMTLPPATSFGTTACTPSSVESGSNVRCRFFGLPPGASTITVRTTTPSGTTTDTYTDEPVASDGSWAITTRPGVVGPRTLQLTASGVTRTVQLNVTPSTLGVSILQSANGSLVATTQPGARCILYALLPNSEFSQAAGLNTVKTADSMGSVSWTYTKITVPRGTGTHRLFCNVGAITQLRSATFTIP